MLQNTELVEEDLLFCLSNFKKTSLLPDGGKPRFIMPTSSLSSRHILRVAEPNTNSGHGTPCPYNAFWRALMFWRRMSELKHRSDPDLASPARGNPFDTPHPVLRDDTCLLSVWPKAKAQRSLG